MTSVGKHSVTCTGDVNAAQDVWDNFKVRCVHTYFVPPSLGMCTAAMEFRDAVLATLISDNEFETRILKVDSSHHHLLVSFKKSGSELKLLHAQL